VYHQRILANSRLSSASLAARGGSSLGVGGTLVGLGTLLHHDGEGDVTTLGIFVSGLTRVDARGIGAVALPGLERVEVRDSAGGSGVPLSVDFDLGVVVPHAIVVLSVVTEKLHRRTHTKGGGREGRSGGHKGEEGKGFGGELRCGKAEEEKCEREFVLLLGSRNKDKAIGMLTTMVLKQQKEGAPNR
jgi:hypothetical protein